PWPAAQKAVAPRSPPACPPPCACPLATTRGPTRGATWSPFPLTFLLGCPPWSALALRTLRRGLAGLWEGRAGSLLQLLRCLASANLLFCFVKEGKCRSSPSSGGLVRGARPPLSANEPV